MERKWGGELLCRTVDTTVWRQRTKSKGNHWNFVVVVIVRVYVHVPG